MTAVEVTALAGAASIALGGLTVLWPARLRAGLAAQAAGLAALAGAGAAALFSGDSYGAAFRSDIAPALGLDPLSGFFALVLGLAAAPALWFARDYLAGAAAGRAVGLLTSVFLLALAGLLCARDVTTFLAFWELMTLAPAAAIIATRRDAPVRSAVSYYLAITHLGGAGVWIALLSLARHDAIGDPAALAAHGAGAQALVAIAALIGFGTKAGLVPLHSWLPRAHPVAPAHLSAAMSGVMVKVALYGLIRVEFEWLGAEPLWLGLALLAVGLVSTIGGVLFALLQRDLKRLLAFSSIENVGIVVLGLGASLLFARAGQGDWAAIAFAAALLHVANHAIFKSLLFLAAGAFERAVGRLELDSLGGLLRRMPWTGATFLVGALAIAGLPPLNGFASEWLTLQALVHLAFDQPLGVALAGAVALAGLAIAAALAVITFVKVVGLVLLGPARRPECAHASDPAAGMRAAMAFLAGLCVVLGIVPGLVVPTLAGLAPGPQDAGLAEHAGLAVPGTGGLPALALAVAIAAFTVILVRARGTRSAAPAPTWACGQPVVAELGWTSAGFTKPLRLVLEALLRPRTEVEVVQRGGIVVRVTYASEVPSLAERALYEPAIRTGLRGAALARRLQTGNVRTYALYLLALVIGLLALIRIGALA